MAVIRPYQSAGESLRPLPSPGGAPSGGRIAADTLPPVGQPVRSEAVDGTPRDLMAAGAALEKGSDSLARLALGEMRDANEARVQELNNQFISAQQKMLYTDEGAFYKKRGKDALDGAPVATEQLMGLQKTLLDETKNQYQKERLTGILNGHVNSVTNGMSRFVAEQSTEWQKGVAAGKQALLVNQSRLDNNDWDKVEGLAGAAEGAAVQEAKLAGLTGTDAETALVASRRSAVYGSAIDAMVDAGNQRRALALYERVKPQLDAKTNDRLSTQMKSIQTDVAADDWIAKSGGGGPRENNIGNLRPPGGSTGFQTFQTFDDGVAATVKNLQAYPKAFNGGKDMNLLQIGAKWAPAGDGANDPVQWAKNVGSVAGIDPAKPLDFSDPATMAKLARGIHAAEWGQKALRSDEDYMAGAKAAFGLPPGDKGVGAQKLDTNGLINKASTDPSLNINERASVIGKLTKQSAIVESTRSAAIKGLDDTLEASTQLMIASPSSYTKGGLARIAEGYEAAGDKSKAINTRILAANEDFLLAFAESPDSAQKRILQGLLPGKAQALASGLLAADEKGRTEAAKLAREELSGLKTAAEAGLDIASMEKKAKGAVDLAVKAGDSVLTRDIIDFYDGHVRAQTVGQAPPLAQQQALNDMRTKAEAGDQSNSAIEAYRVTQQIRDKQATEFAKDPVSAGFGAYAKELGQPAPVGSLQRIEQVDKIAKNRGLGDISPFTAPEMAAIKQQVDSGDPTSQAKAFTQIASTVPARMIPQVAAQLAGKGEGDPLSRSYAAALSFFAEKDPASQQLAGQILQGAKITRDLGEAGKKAPAGDQAWQDTLQTRMGNVFRDMGTKVPAVFADAIASVYTYQMHRLGRQGEKIDTDVLDAAAKSVLGQTVTRNGQAFLPPVRGMDSYEVDKAVRSLSDGDLDGLATTEGDPITADKVINRGILTNAGREGMYFVRIPDPRAGMDPRPVVRPDGRMWELDLRPLIERSRMFPGDLAPTPDAGSRARARAPTSPTEGLTP